MTIEFCSFASGSSGNCYMIKNSSAALLIDAGISGKRILQSLKNSGVNEYDVSGILVTHEHIDHVKSLPILTKKLPNVSIYANAATWQAIERPVPEEKRRHFTTGKPFEVDDFLIRPFSIPHDAAEPVGFSIFCEEKQISIVTDIGYITDRIFDEIKDADLLLLEANHEEEILLMSSYPYSLKRRILGENGHLSNVSAGECLCNIIETNPKKRRILLGHLSHENNDPSVALLAVKNTLLEKGIFTGGTITVDVALRDTCSLIYEV